MVADDSAARADGSGRRGQLCAIAGGGRSGHAGARPSRAIRLIDYALTETVLTLKSQWYPAMEKGELSFDNQPDRVAFVLAADGTTDVTKIRAPVFRKARADRRRPGAAVGDVGQGRRAGRSCVTRSITALAIRRFSMHWPHRPCSATKGRRESWPSR